MAGEANCVSFAEAGRLVGSHHCVEGRVVRVEAGNGGVHYLDFCENYRECPFTVVVFAGDLRQVGDVRQLAGKQIEIRGDVREYDGRAEIILERASQLQGEASRLPPMPKAYDVENRGHYSAGRLRPTKKPAKVKAKPNTAATYGNDVEGEEPPD